MLSNLPMYLLSIFPSTANVARRLECLQSVFLWDGPDDKSKFHMLNWKAICSSVPKGGLGVKNLMSFNKSLLSNGFGDLCKRR
jgi:hypothetical protein